MTMHMYDREMLRHNRINQAPNIRVINLLQTICLNLYSYLICCGVLPLLILFTELWSLLDRQLNRFALLFYVKNGTFRQWMGIFFDQEAVYRWFNIRACLVILDLPFGNRGRFTRQMVGYTQTAKLWKRTFFIGIA